MSEFKNCESVGLKVQRRDIGDSVINAADVEKLLEKSFKVTGTPSGIYWALEQIDEHKGHERRGLVIDLGPIVRDSAELILKEMISTFDFTTKNPCLHVVDKSLIDRAKKLIERGS